MGGLVLVVAAAWYLLLGAAFVYPSQPIPDWVANLQAFMFGVSMLGIGYLLRGEHEQPDRTEQAADAPA